MTENVHNAIHFLEARGFRVKGYGYPESDFGGESSVAEQYRVLQGDFDTGMIAPQQLVEVVQRIKSR